MAKKQFNALVDEKTIEAIKRQAAVWQCSQGAVVEALAASIEDEALPAYRVVASIPAPRMELPPPGAIILDAVAEPRKGKVASETSTPATRHQWGDAYDRMRPKGSKK